MAKKIVILSFGIFIMLACSPATDDKREEKKDDKDTIALTGAERDFFKHISSLCGKKFAGEEKFMRDKERSFGDAEMIIHVESCTENEIRIPFHVGSDESRTWLLLEDEGRLRLRHDHRHEDGTPEETTMYGGYSDQQGTEYSQYFPPDDYTYETLENAEGHKWSFTLSEDLKTLAYCLKFDDELIFRAEFNIDEPIN